jgi:hypothetical protein
MQREDLFEPRSLPFVLLEGLFAWHSLAFAPFEAGGMRREDLFGFHSPPFEPREEEGMELGEEGMRLEDLFASCTSDSASREEEGMSRSLLLVSCSLGGMLRELRGTRLEESIGSREDPFPPRRRLLGPEDEED